MKCLEKILSSIKSFPLSAESRVLFGITLPPLIGYIAGSCFFYLLAFENDGSGLGRWIWLALSSFLIAVAVLTAVLLLLRSAANGIETATAKFAVRLAAVVAGAVCSFVVVELISGRMGLERFRGLAVMLFLPTALSAVVLLVEACRRRRGVLWAALGMSVLLIGALVLRWWGGELTVEELIAAVIGWLLLWYLAATRGWFLLSGMGFREFFAPSGWVWSIWLAALIINLFITSVENIRVREAYRHLEKVFGTPISVAGLAEAYYGGTSREAAVDASDNKFRIDVDPDSGWWNFSSRLNRTALVPNWRKIVEWRDRNAAAIAELEALAYREVKFRRPENLVLDASGGMPGEDAELLVRAARLNYLLLNLAINNGDRREALQRFYAIGGLLRSAGADVFVTAVNRAAEIELIRIAALEQLLEHHWLPENLLRRLLNAELAADEPDRLRQRAGLGNAVILRGSIEQLLAGGGMGTRPSLITLKQLGALFPPAIFLIRHFELEICSRLEDGNGMVSKPQRMFLPGNRSGGEEFLSQLPAAVELARCGVAAELFRLRNGRMPERLDELVPEYLSELPVDPDRGVPAELSCGPQVVELDFPRAYPGEWGGDHGGKVLLTAPGCRFFFPGREEGDFLLLPPRSH